MHMLRRPLLVHLAGWTLHVLGRPKLPGRRSMREAVSWRRPVAHAEALRRWAMRAGRWKAIPRNGARLTREAMRTTRALESRRLRRPYHER